MDVGIATGATDTADLYPLPVLVVHLSLYPSATTDPATTIVAICVDISVCIWIVGTACAHE
jgi:hypothetical protein